MKISSAFLLGTKIKAAEPAPPPVSGDWEVSWMYGFRGYYGIITVNEGYQTEYLKNETGIVNRDLVKTDMHEIPGRAIFTANQALVARQGDSSALEAFANFAADAVIQDRTHSFVNYEQLVVAKKTLDITIPAEIGFFWRVNSLQSAQGCILKRDGTFIPWQSPNTYGEVLAFDYQFKVLVNRNFTGTLKYFTFGDMDGGGARWVDVQTPVTDDLNMDTMIVFAIPNS